MLVQFKMAEKQTLKMAETAYKDIMEELMNYSNEQLRVLLVKHSLDKMPLTQQTKSVLVKKLAQKMTNFDGSCPSYEPSAQSPALTQSSCSIASTSSHDKAVDAHGKDSVTKHYAKQASSESCDSLTSCHSDGRHMYYVVCIPGPTNAIKVYDSFTEVMKTMKEHRSKNPRMLSFISHEKAEEFANTHTALEVCEGSTIKSAYPQEKAEVESGEVKLFPSLSPPQINQFRIQLERGNLSFAKECIISNPKFLIGNGDMPTILKEGPRYNALHACVMAARLESCRLVMETVSNVDYLCRMYTSQKRAEESSLRLIDLYLNTPDKTANKTPLHLASEKGMVDIVAFLVSFKACIRKFNRQVPVGKSSDETRPETPEEVVCSRYIKFDKAAVKAKILELIQGGTCYVPLIRSDTTGPYAKVGAPYSPTSPYRLVPEIEGAIRHEQQQQQQLQQQPSPRKTMSTVSEGTDVTSSPAPSATTVGINSPGGPAGQELRDFRSMRVWAFAGPMSPQEADEFRREWRCPSKGSNPRDNFKIVDGDRGFERFGRTLAEEHRTSWQEYWPFLDAFADLRSLEGLAKMETFFLKQRVLILMQTMATWKGGGRIGKNNGVMSDNQTSSRQKDLEKSLESAEGGKSAVKVQETLKTDDTDGEPCRPGGKDQEPVEVVSCFVTSPAYTIGQQFVLNPDSQEVETFSDGFGSPQSASDDDKYFSAESSSDSEEDGEERCKDHQRDRVSFEPAVSQGILGSLWQGLGRLREYISPRKTSPASSPLNSSSPSKDNQSCAKNSHAQSKDEPIAEEKNLKQKSDNSASLQASVKSLDFSKDQLQTHPKPDQLKCHLGESDADELLSNTSDMSNSLASDGNGKHCPLVTSSCCDNPIDKNRNVSISCTPLSQNSQSDAVARSLSSQPNTPSTGTRENNPQTEESSKEDSISLPENQVSPNTSSQWQYRDSQAEVFSPEASPTRHTDHVSKDGEGEYNEENLSSFQSQRNPALSTSTTLTPTQIECQRQQEDSSSEPTGDDSFNTKLDNLCVSLSKFSLQSPASQSSKAGFDVTPDTSCENISDISSSPRETAAKPSIHLFVGKLYSQFLSYISPQKCSKDGQDIMGVARDSSIRDSEVPTLILRQGQNGEVVLADVFLPFLSDSRHTAATSVLDPSAPVMPEEAHRDAIRSVWVNFVAAFSLTWEAKELCGLDQPLVVKAVVTGVVDDMEKSWMCSEDCPASRDVQALYLKCKEEEFAATQSTSVMVRIVRASSLPSRDLYICGSTPTKVDADVYHTMSASTKDLIREEDNALSLTRLWLTQMESRGADGIDSLPSPSRVLRSSRRAPPPISPLVKNETPSSSRNISHSNASVEHTPLMAGHKTKQAGHRLDALPAKKLFQQEL